jgi:formate dehydrogenase iron-sulfur subunit
LLLDQPETYGLPANPKLPSRSVLPSSLFSIGSAIAVGLAALFSFRVRRVNEMHPEYGKTTREEG